MCDSQQQVFYSIQITKMSNINPIIDGVSVGHVYDSDLSYSHDAAVSRRDIQHHVVIGLPSVSALGDFHQPQDDADSSTNVPSTNATQTSRDDGIQTTSCFPRFSELPIELQDTIWELATPTRLIEIQYRPTSQDSKRSDFKPTLNVPLPAIFYVSSASRSATERICPSHFNDRIRGSFSRKHRGDILVVDPATLKRMTGHALKGEGVRRLAVRLEHLTDFAFMTMELFGAIRSFRSLEEMILSVLRCACGRDCGRSGACTAVRDTVAQMQNSMQSRYGKELQIWKMMKRAPLYSLPRFTCLTDKELEERVDGVRVCGRRERSGAEWRVLAERHKRDRCSEGSRCTIYRCVGTFH